MQQEFQFECAGSDIASRLEPSLGFSPKVTLTDNRVSIVSVRKFLGGAAIKIHRCFAFATDDVLSALARFIKRSDRGAKRIIKAFYEASAPVRAAKRTVRKRRAVFSKGEHYDLAQILDDLNARYFGGKIKARITWGRRRNSRRGFKRSRHITLGSYDRQRGLVVIHPNLDRKPVPRFFVEAIVFHEMCHEAVPGDTKGGRRKIHTAAFKEMEKRFPMLAEARRFAKENMEYLVGARKSVSVR